MMPILPANAVSSVLPFLVIRLLALRDNAVKNDMDVPFFFFALLALLFSVTLLSVGSYGMVSSVTLPSKSLTIRDEYFSASSGL